MKFEDYVKEAKIPDFRKVKIGSKKWKEIWQKYPELQDDMLAWRKSKESKWLKSKMGTKFAVQEAYFSDMTKIQKEMEDMVRELKKDKYPPFFVREVEKIIDQWKKLTTKLA